MEFETFFWCYVYFLGAWKVCFIAGIIIFEPQPEFGSLARLLFLFLPVLPLFLALVVVFVIRIDLEQYQLERGFQFD